MPQPDSGDNCCDCPSRTSPCDDCGTPPEGCAACGDRLTAVFTGVSGSACLTDYTWPMGLTSIADLGGGEILYTWNAVDDGGTAGGVPCLSGGAAIQVVAQCGTVSGWSLAVLVDGVVTFSSGGSGSFPIGTPIPNGGIGGGSVIITCGGSWGACCAGGPPFFACYGCTDPVSGLPGGMGPEQCEILINDLTGHAVFQGDHSKCSDDPCGVGPC